MAQSFLFALGRRRADELPVLGWLAAALEGLLFRVLLGMAAWLGPDRASRWGGAAFAAIGPRLSKNRHVLNNLSIALPHLSEDDIATLATKVWHETGRVVAELPHLETICGSQADQRMEIVDHYGLEPVKNGEQAAIFVTAHFGNWELAAGVCRKVPFDLSVLHTNFSNERIDNALMRYRQALGCDFVPRQHGARGMIKALQRKRSIGVVMDQRYDDGQLVKFFGKPAPTGTAAAAIALKMKVDLVPVKVERLIDARYRISFMPAIEPNTELPPAQQPLAMTEEVLAQFEDWIRERPELWMCLKRRWPKAHNRPV